MVRKLTLLALAALLILSCSLPAFAQESDVNRTGSITITLKDQTDAAPVSGGEFAVYQVADTSIHAGGTASYAYTDAFRDCGIPLEDPELAAKLNVFVREHPVPARTVVTDERGVAVCADLPLGLYLVKQTKTVAQFSACTPFLVSVPIRNGETLVYDVDASPKMDMEELVTISVRKEWNTGRESHPDSVTLQLLRDNTPVHTVTLTEANGWQATYENMPKSDSYSILEVDVPQGYTATYSRQGWEFLVTNTPTLAQTGQLIWPIPVLAVAGVLFLMIGFVLLRKPENRHG